VVPKSPIWLQNTGEGSSRSKQIKRKGLQKIGTKLFQSHFVVDCGQCTQFLPFSFVSCTIEHICFSPGFATAASIRHRCGDGRYLFEKPELWAFQSYSGS